MKNVCENNRRYFLSINHTHYTPPLKNADYTGKKRWSSAGKLDNAHKNLEKLNQASKDFDLSISGSGINLSTKANADKQVQGTEAWNTSPEEQKLSEKAKKYLASLREQYGDYDFLIADDVQNPLDIAGPSHKKYFVILSTQEIERMANDDVKLSILVDTFLQESYSMLLPEENHSNSPVLPLEAYRLWQSIYGDYSSRIRNNAR